MIKKKNARAWLFLICSLFVLIAQAQTSRNITGIVNDANGVPLPNASVQVKGTQVFAVTNDKGVFAIAVPEGSNTLVITYVGLPSKEAEIVGEGLQVITMSGSATVLGDVVVVGYGTARRSNLTTAQTGVTAKDIEKTINTTFEQAIQGRAAGVYVTQNSGQPGGALSVNIRGISSLNRTQPLYVIDGVQIQANEDVSYGDNSSANPLAGLNPSGIEGMQILQGPSATA